MQDTSIANMATRLPERSPQPSDAVTTTFTTFGRDSLGKVCTLVRLTALNSGVAPRDVDDLLIAVSEVVTNVVCHAGGVGSMTLEFRPGGLLVEISDNGTGLPESVMAALPSFDGIQLGGLRRARLLCQKFEVISSSRGVTVRIFTPYQDAR